MKKLLALLILFAATAEAQIFPYGSPLVADTSVAITNTTSTQVLAAPGARKRLNITEVTVTNSAAAVGTDVELLCGSSIEKVHYARQDGGGFAIAMVAPIRCGVNEAFNARAVTTGAAVRVSATGYISTR